MKFKLWLENVEFDKLEDSGFSPVEIAKFIDNLVGDFATKAQTALNSAKKMPLDYVQRLNLISYQDSIEKHIKTLNDLVEKEKENFDSENAITYLNKSLWTFYENFHALRMSLTRHQIPRTDVGASLVEDVDGYLKLITDLILRFRDYRGLPDYSKLT